MKLIEYMEQVVKSGKEIKYQELKSIIHEEFAGLKTEEEINSKFIELYMAVQAYAKDNNLRGPDKMRHDNFKKAFQNALYSQVVEEERILYKDEYYDLMQQIAALDLSREYNREKSLPKNEPIKKGDPVSEINKILNEGNNGPAFDINKAGYTEAEIEAICEQLRTRQRLITVIAKQEAELAGLINGKEKGAPNGNPRK